MSNYKAPCFYRMGFVVIPSYIELPCLNIKKLSMTGGAYPFVILKISIINTSIKISLVNCLLFIFFLANFKVTFIVTTYYSNRSFLYSVDEITSFPWGENPDYRTVTELRFHHSAKSKFFLTWIKIICYSQQWTKLLSGFPTNDFNLTIKC